MPAGIFLSVTLCWIPTCGDLLVQRAHSPMKFALSTCWNSHRHDDGYAMLAEVADLGYEYVELSHGIRISLVPGIIKAVEEGMIKVSSLHNFCPLPVGVMGAAPNLYEPTAAHHRERALWYNNTLRTIEFAERMHCDRIVMHCGKARLLWNNPGEKVHAAFEAAGGEASDALKAAREKGLSRLNRKKTGFMKRLRESCELIADRAKQAGVRMGIENREAFSELPLDADMADLLDDLKDLEVFGYWHDSGHAQLKERMGLLDHRQFLATLRPHLLGLHLHDVDEKNRDHRVPGTGVIDWSFIAEMIQPGDAVILELSPTLKKEQVVQAREFIVKTIPALTGK